MSNKNKKIFIGIITGLIAILIVVYSLLMSGIIKIDNNTVTPDTPDETIVEPIEDDTNKTDPETLKKYKDRYNEYKAINPDYVGELFFDSGLINVSFVQAKSVYKPNGEMYKFYTEDGKLVTDPTGYSGNDVYIWTYWKTGEYDYNDNGGSTFLDYLDELSDQNLTIYGHHFSPWNDPEGTKAFTPLEKLLEEENFKGNETATIVLGDEIRKYEVAAVYIFDYYNDNHVNNMQYWRRAYNYDDYTGVQDDNYYQNYIDTLKTLKLYDTGVELTTNDKTVSLQTCISGHVGELYEIVVLKEVSVEKY